MTSSGDFDYMYSCEDPRGIILMWRIPYIENKRKGSTMAMTFDDTEMFTLWSTLDTTL